MLLTDQKLLGIVSGSIQLVQWTTTSAVHYAESK